MLNGLVAMSSQNALVEGLRRRQCRPVAKQNIEYLEGGNVAPEYDQNEGQRHGEHKPIGPQIHVQNRAAMTTDIGDRPVE